MYWFTHIYKMPDVTSDQDKLTHVTFYSAHTTSSLIHRQRATPMSLVWLLSGYIN